MQIEYLIYNGKRHDSEKPFDIEAQATLFHARPVVVLVTTHKQTPFVLGTVNESGVVSSICQYELRTDAMKGFADHIQRWAAA